MGGLQALDRQQDVLHARVGGQVLLDRRIHDAEAAYWWHWCPGQELPAGTQDRVVDWDWNVCHDYYYQSNGNGNQPADIIDEAGRVYSAAPSLGRRTAPMERHHRPIGVRRPLAGPNSIVWPDRLRNVSISQVTRSA